MITDEMIQRVENGTGADRELDLAVCLAIGRLSRDDEGRIFYIDRDDGCKVFGSHWEIITPELTGSIDRVVALIEAKLPGWTWYVQTYEGRPSEAAVWPPQTPSGLSLDQYSGFATSPARALLAAALRALKETTP